MSEIRTEFGLNQLIPTKCSSVEIFGYAQCPPPKNRPSCIATSAGLSLGGWRCYQDGRRRSQSVLTRTIVVKLLVLTSHLMQINTRSNAPSSRSRTSTSVSRRQPLTIHRRHYNGIFHLKILVTTRIVVEAESWPLFSLTIFSKSQSMAALLDLLPGSSADIHRAAQDTGARV